MSDCIICRKGQDGRLQWERITQYQDCTESTFYDLEEAAVAAYYQYHKVAHGIEATEPPLIFWEEEQVEIRKVLTKMPPRACACGRKNR